MTTLYKDPETGDVYGYDDEQISSGFVKEGLVKMSESEVLSHIQAQEYKPTVEDIERMRLCAYADPVTGSDRHFAEAFRLQAAGADKSKVEEVLRIGNQRYLEIKEQHPWPEK